MKKRLLSMILALSMMLTILPVNAITALAENGKVVKSGNCGINGGSNVTYTLTQNNDDDTNPTYTLTIEGSGAMRDYEYFYNDAPWKSYCGSTVTKIVIKEGVTSIGAYAFHQCGGLTGELSIPNSVTSIGKYAFYECNGLTGELSIPDSVTSIGNYAFYGCSGLTGGLSIPNRVISIGDYAFYGCSGFTGELSIPDSVTSIGKHAFHGCSGFTGELSIPDSVTSIGDYAFYGCSGLTGGLSIPDGVTSIGDYAFYGCSGFTEELSIPDGVISIGDYAFYGCSGFTGELSIPDSVTSIGNAAFYGCKGFTGELSIPDSVTSIGEYAFGGCSSLTSVAIPNGETTIPKGTFSGCSGLTSIVIPSTVDTIKSYAFFGCNGLTSVVIPSTVDTIESYAFSECKSLESVTISEGVTLIKNKAFYNSENLTKVELPLEVPAIESGAFDGTNYLSFKIYYSGYKTDWLNQPNVVNGSVGSYSVNKYVGGLSKDKKEMYVYGPNGFGCTGKPIGYYIDVPFDANGGVFEDDTGRKTMEKARHGDYLTQEQINSVGVPKKAGKVCIGWSTDANDTTPIDFTSSGGATVDDDTVFYAVYRDAKPATITIGDSNKTFKAGTESDSFIVTATKGETDAAKVKFEFENGTVQYKNSSTEWTNLTGNEISIDKLNSALFRIATSKDATVGTTPLTVKLVTEQGTEMGVNATADFTVTARTPATIAITEPTNKNVKAGEPSQTFTMNITNHDDEVGSVTFDFDGEVQYADNTYGPNWTTVTGSVSRAIATSKYFRVVPKADAVAGDMTLTAKLVDTDGNEITGATASTTFNVTARKHAEVTINGLDTDNTVKAGNDKTFTVSVTPNDDANTGAKATIEVSGANADAVEKIQYKDGETWKDIPSDGLSIDDINNTEFKIITKADANNGNVTITVVAKKADGTEIDTKDATITVKKHENAEVTIDGLDDDLKQGESKDFTVKVDPKDDSGKATIDFGDKNSEIQYKDGEDWKPMPDTGRDIDLSDGAKDYEFRITPKDDGNNQKLTATVKKDGNELGKAEKTYNVSEYVDAAVKIDGLNGTVETDTEKEFTVTVTANDDAGKTVTAKAGFTGPADATVTLKKVQYRFGDSGEWQDGMPALNGMNLNINDLELPFNNLRDITYKLTVAFAKEGTYTFNASLTKKDATEAFTSDSAEITITKKDEPVNPNPGGDGGNTNPGGDGGNTNPGGDGGNTKPGGDSGNTGDGDHTGDKDPETRSYELTVIGGSFTAKQGENALTVETTKADNSLTAKIPEGAVVTVTLNKDAVPEGMVFDQWKINDDDLMGNPDVAYDQETFHFTMPEHDVKVEVMYRDATIESDGPGILGTGAMIATVGISAAALAYQGHMLGTEFALRCMLPEWALIPQNRAELAVLLWSDAEGPEPVSTNLYSDISEDDSAVQKAARWAVENDLMELLDAEEAPENFDPFVPVTYLDSIHAWKKAQELKK